MIDLELGYCVSCLDIPCTCPEEQKHLAPVLTLQTSTSRPTDRQESTPQLAQLLADVRSFVGRFVILPSTHDEIAVALWIAHTHAVDSFDSTPRIAFLSPEPGSGKSRALEVITTLVPAPMHAVNATPAALFRSVSDLEHRPTILFDEIDTVFGPKAKENEEVRGFLNAGHRRGAVAYRCVGEGTKQTVQPFPSFCAVAIAGLNDIPDTIATRSIIVRMQRRKPSQSVEPWRARQMEPEGFQLRSQLEHGLETIRDALEVARPSMPTGLVDRPADVWEPLLAIADAAGGEWPALAREAALAHVTGPVTEPSLGVLLLRHLRELWIAKDDPKHLHGAVVIAELIALDESPWGSLRGAPIDARKLSSLLKRYGIRSSKVRESGNSVNGYTRESLWPAWESYCPDLLLPLPEMQNIQNTRNTGPIPSQLDDENVPGVPEHPLNVPDTKGPIPSQVPGVPDVPDLAQREAEAVCEDCTEPLSDFDLELGFTTHASCTQPIPNPRKDPR